MTYSNGDQWRWANEYDERTEKLRKIAAKVVERNGDGLRKINDGGDTIKINDKLDKIFEMQAQLDNRIIRERNIEKSLDEWVIDITIAMESEIDEIRREVNWKWWKNPKEIDREKLKGEVIDMWHFLVSLSQKVGLTAEDVYRVYCEKNTENHARQDGTSKKKGYSLDELLSKITPENRHEEIDM
jgi:dimeric dUTPase (all-alpha-NTP-PPase superfamily)